MSDIRFHPALKEIIRFHNSLYSFHLLLRDKVKGNQVIFSKEDVGVITEAFVIKQVADWDNFVENVLAICLLTDTSKLSEHLDLDLPKKITFDNAKAIINGLNYFDIKSSGDIKGIAKKILVKENNPFQEIDKLCCTNIDEMYAIRNYIAHKSKKAKKRLMTIYQNRYNLNEFIEPGIFFQEMSQENGDQWELYYATYLNVAVTIWKYLDEVTYNFVFEDDQSKEGLLKGFGKMKHVFIVLTRQIDEKKFPAFPQGLIV